MLRLLKIKAKGFRMIDDNFELDLTTKTKVYQKDKEHEVFEVNKSLYLFRSMAFVGKNASGKSTVLTLLRNIYVFLQTGRWEYSCLDFKKDKIELNLVFYLNDALYEYDVTFGKIDDDKLVPRTNYSPILNEKLKKLDYNKSRGIKNLELLSAEGIEANELINSTLGDTSSIINLTKDAVMYDEFTNNNISNFDMTLVVNTFYKSLTSCNIELLSSIIKLLDESIEYIKYESANSVKFKRINEEEKEMTNFQLLNILSSGTFRGVELYVRCINALKDGKVLIVDELENCFQKNLINNLLVLFNDSEINIKNAQIIFSTHYFEILDNLDRRDSIYIAHKINGKITIKNFYDYNIRTEILKSNLFDNNVFDTSLNYEQLMNVRRMLKHELQTNND